MLGSNIRPDVKTRLQRIKTNFTLMEISGSLGDLGTLIPILISLSITHQVSLASSLVFGGLFNILSGFMFGVPICVQPMKAIAAAALSKQLSNEEIASAGMFVSGVVFFLGVTGLLTLVNRWIPLPVIKGIQVGAGLQLMFKAVDMLAPLAWWGSSIKWQDNYWWVLFTCAIVLVGFKFKRFPSAFVVFIIGLIIAIIDLVINKKQGPRFEIIHFPIVVPSPSQFVNGIVQAGIGQFPLTTLNSVIAVIALANELFPQQGPFTPRPMAASVGIMNLIGCWFGSMPFCHGSGGLAGQYRFGARTEVSTLVLGLIKLFLGLFLGQSLLGLLNCFPKSILAVLLFVSGLELAKAGRVYSTNMNDDKSRQNDFMVLLVTTGLLTGYKNDLIGFVGGMVTYYVTLIIDKLNQRFKRPSVETDESA